jgi:hypothetical protein
VLSRSGCHPDYLTSTFAIARPIVALLEFKVFERQLMSPMELPIARFVCHTEFALRAACSADSGRPPSAPISSSSRDECRKISLSITELAGHLLGTPRRKPRESQKITRNVIPQLVAGSPVWPGSVQQFNPDRRLQLSPSSERYSTAFEARFGHIGRPSLWIRPSVDRDRRHARHESHRPVPP